jgi:hypothetical protein
MFHLIGRVYLAPDFTTDMANDRVVISVENGFDSFQLIQGVMLGTLHRFGPTVDEVVGDDFIQFFEDLIELSNTSGRSIYIYADAAALPKIQALWFKLTLANIDVDTCYNIYNSNIHKYNLFYRSTISSNSGSNGITYSIDPELIRPELEYVRDLAIDENSRIDFCNRHKSLLGIEYLLANYIYNKTLKTELKISLKRIIRKHFDNILLECKTMFLTYYTNNNFAEKIQLQNRYSFNNLSDILNDNSAVAEFFLSARLYRTLEVTKPYTDSNFVFENMTDEDLETLSTFMSALGPSYEINNGILDYSDELLKFKEGYKWRFLDCVRDNFTDELLDTLIEVEASIGSASGIFFNILLETVNSFTVQQILSLYRDGNTEQLRKFIVFE